MAEDLLRKKNLLVADAHRFEMQMKESLRLAARLEAILAGRHLRAGDIRGALINLVSQASCLKCIGEREKAERVLLRIVRLAKEKRQVAWAISQLPELWKIPLEV